MTDDNPIRAAWEAAMRRVEIRNITYPKGFADEPEILHDGFGWFHGFGINYEEFYGSGPMQFTCAIVERADGTISLLGVDAIRFLEPEPAP